MEQNFFLLAPYAVTETELVSGIPDAENQIYSGATTYATGDLVWDSGKIWRSLVDGNVGNTLVEGANWTDLGEIDEGALAYNAGTTYALNAYSVYEGYIYKAAVDGESGNTPSATSTKWTRIGATNRFKAFDGFIQDAATLTEEINFDLTFASYVSQIAILRAEGVSVTVTMTDDTAGEVFNETVSLLDETGIIDAWTYCFSDFVESDTVIVEDLPPYANADIRVTISGDAAVSVGQIVLGSGTPLGVVTTGTGVGIESYSVKDRDSFNRSLIVARPYSDTVDFNLKVNTTQTGFVKRRLAERDALATLYFMSGGAPYAAIAYGYYKNFDILHSTSVLSDCVLEIEGLG